MTRRPQVVEVVVALAAQAAGGVAVTEAPSQTAGGFSHLTFRVGLGGRACVVKAASAPDRRDEVRTEAATLPRVRGVVPVPEVVGVAESDADGWTVLVTDEVAGTHGFEVLRDSNDLAPYARRLGATLGRVHDAGWVHGDAGFHNTLWDARGELAALLDWEWASSVAPPLVDLAWVWWTFRFRRLPPAAWDAFAAGYGRMADWSRDMVLASVRKQMDRHLTRVAGDATLTEEWHRRRHDLDRLAAPW